VVLDSFFSAGGLVTLVSFFLQAASAVTPRSRQIYFFMYNAAEYPAVFANKGACQNAAARSAFKQKQKAFENLLQILSLPECAPAK
jgi:hypothetical protein